MRYYNVMFGVSEYVGLNVRVESGSAREGQDPPLQYNGHIICPADMRFRAVPSLPGIPEKRRRRWRCG